ncbi:hypothetical protein BKA62DRAFT_770459 [Auriculariales sp. MPI-PUGE-AT-0066]|nr:hypothetical protein BKA62DRAFT_770459 [Auriculariales sp. MPI-PUGE-AT-0066]
MFQTTLRRQINDYLAGLAFIYARFATDSSGQLAVPTFNANIPTGASAYGHVPTFHSSHPWRDVKMDAIERSSKARVYRGWWTDPSEDEKAEGSKKPKLPRRKRTHRQTNVMDKYARDGRADHALAFALVSEIARNLRSWFALAQC